MFDFGGLGYLPIGMALALAMFVAHRLRHRERRASTDGIVALAQRLGLSHRPGATGQIGRLSGHYRGYEVHADPDDQCVIRLLFMGSPAIDLRSFEATPRKHSGLSPFYSRSKSFDRLFKHRYVQSELADRLNEHDLETLAIPFVRTWYRNVVRLTVNEAGIECRLRFGTPPYIPIVALEQLLDAIVELALVVEPHESPAVAFQSST